MIVVLRLGHRHKRDERVSTHCGLVARAFGADRIIYAGEKDEKLLTSVHAVTERWGGRFTVLHEPKWKNVITNHKKKGFCIVHLTMYGLPLQNEIRKIRKTEKLLVVIGSEKVPGEVYTLSDFNISITQQPHSEVAALAVFLHEYFRGKELTKRFRGRVSIVPQAHGKRLVDRHHTIK